MARWLALALLGLLLAVPPPCRAAPEDEAEVVVEYWNYMIFDPPKTVVAQLIDEFNATHPRIHVRSLDVPQMQEKLLTSTVGRVPPDVATFDRFHVAGYAERGALLPLDDLATRAGIRGADFFHAPWNEGIHEGQQYCIPLQTDVRVLFYNKALFREAGLDPERPPRDWEELRDYSRRLTKRDERGRLVQAGFIPYFGFGNTWLYLYGWQKGARFLSEDSMRATLDDPRLIESLEWTRDFTADYGVDDLKLFASGFGSLEMDPFLQGQVAMSGEEVLMLSRIRRYNPGLELGLAPLPWPKDGQHVTWSGGFGFIIPRGAAHPEEAMEFIAHMVSRESQLRYGQYSNQLPANRTATEAPFYADDPQWRLLVGEMEHSRHRPVTPVGTLMWQELARAWETGGGDGVEPAVALDRAQRSVQAALDRLAGTDALPLVNWTLVWIVLGGCIAAALGLRAASSWRKVRRTSLLRAEARAGYLFSLPATAGLLLLWIGPVVVIFVYSFSQYDILSPARWTGLGNYRRLLLDDPLFWKSLWNTLYFAALATPTAVAGSLGLALLLNQEIRGRSVWRALFYLPSIVPLVALSLLFLWLLNAQNGLFNLVLEAVGLPRIPWLTSPLFSKPSLLLMNMFTIGAGMVIFLAGLQGVPRHLHEAAMIDGAGVLARFRNVTLPSLLPTIFFMVVIYTIMSFQVFTQAFLMTSTSSPGAPEDSLMFYVFYLFIQGFVNFNMGYASAMALILFVIIVVVTIIQYRVALRLGYEDVMR